MGVDFSAGAGAGSSTDLIPNGQMAWVIISFREMKVGQNSGARYADLELTIDDGQPFARRKVWYKLMDPMDGNSSAGAKEMGMAAITRILEAHRWQGRAEPFNEEWFKAQGGYVIGSYSPESPSYADLHLMRAAVKIKITPPKDGFAEKNEVAEFLSPNPKSASNKSYLKLMSGVFNTTAQPAASAQGSFGGFGAPAAQPATQPAAFGGQPAAQPAQGGQAAAGAAPFAASTAPVSARTESGAAGQTTASAASPSNPAPAPAAQPVMAGGASWIQQAQQPTGS